ncbi:MAG: hypothetical protein GY870_12520 [archaeon]|nr:hypothetical protein [archaeon]
MTEEKCLDDWGYKKYAERFKQLIDKGAKKYKYPADLHSSSFRNSLNKCLITEIDPYLFTILAAPKCHIKESSVDYLWDAYEEQKEVLDPLYLDIDPNECRIEGHEGRHRAEIAYDLGIEKVPVRVCFFRYRPFKVKGQEFSDNESNFLTDEIKKHGFSKEIVDKWMKDNNASWSYPEKCNLDNVKSEGYGTERLKTRDTAKRLRDQENITDMHNDWRRMLMAKGLLYRK